MEQEMTTPGAFLRQQLKENGITQSELAKKTGFSTKHINRVINNKNRMSMKFALRVEDTVGIPATKLIHMQVLDELKKGKKYLNGV